MLDEKAKLIENIDKKYAIKTMEEGEGSRAINEQEKQQRIQEVEHKFKEIIDMLVENYSSNM